MAATTHNTPATTPKGAILLGLRPAFATVVCYPEQRSDRNRHNLRRINNLTNPTRNSFRHPQSITLTVSGGRACPVGRQRLVATNSPVVVFLVDTRVGIENRFSPAESITSRKLSRYTFDMSGKEVFQPNRRSWSLSMDGAEGIMGA